MSEAAPLLKMNDGRSIPQLGVGVFRIPDDETAALVRKAIEIGYRHVDTASLYGNEKGVGEGVLTSGMPREDLFVTSKVWNDRHGFEETTKAFHESLDRLGLEYLDLYLVHWPAMHKGGFVDSWRSLEKLQAEGLVRSIGVSNFQIHHLNQLLVPGTVPPAVNQVELNPWIPLNELRVFDAENDIRTVAWQPLAKGAVLEHQVIQSIAKKHERTPAQIVIRWHLDIGNVAIPKSGSAARLAENFAVFDFALDSEDVLAIDTVRRNHW